MFFAQPTNSVAPLEDIRCSTKVSFFLFVVFLSQIIWIAAVYLTIAAVHLTII